MLSDSIGDMITRIRNGCMIQRKFIFVPHSKLRERVLEVLLKEGYLRSYEVVKVDQVKREIKIGLKYRDGQPVIRHLRRLSKPSRRVYSNVAEMRKVFSGLGSLILSTSKGVMSDADARTANVGGEILFEVF